MLDICREGSRIAIWGTGDIGREFYSKYKNIYQIECFLDNRSKDFSLFEKPIYRYEEYLEGCLDKPLIIIATSKYCSLIMEQLQNYGLCFGVDYIPFVLFEQENKDSIEYFSYRRFLSETESIKLVQLLKGNKKLAVIYGNCQTAEIQRYLIHNTIFREKYIFLQVPMVCEYCNQEMLSCLKEDFWQECDLFISQRVRDDNRFSPFLASERIVSYLPKGVRKIWIPNIFFRGYFPQAIKNQHNVDLERHPSGKFPFGDKYVDTFIQESIPVKEIISNITRMDFFSEIEIKKVVRDSLDELERRDMECDVHIVDYIKNHYKARQLFYSENHPINEVIREMARRILQTLGIKNKNFFNEAYLSKQISLRGQDVPIYPSVKKRLGMVDSSEIYYANRYLWPFKASLEGYIKEYIRICWKAKIN